MIKILKLIRMENSGNLRGFFEVEIKGTIIRECRIIQQEGQRAYIAGPQLHLGTGKWVTLVSFSPELRDQIQDLVLPQAAELKIIRG